MVRAPSKARQQTVLTPNPPFLLAVMTMTFFFNVTDTGKSTQLDQKHLTSRAETDVIYPTIVPSPRSHRLVATDRPVDIALLHHFVTPRVFCWYRLRRGGLDARFGVGTPSFKGGTKRMRRAGMGLPAGGLDATSPPPRPVSCACEAAISQGAIVDYGARGMPLDASENGFVGYIRSQRRYLLWPVTVKHCYTEFCLVVTVASCAGPFKKITLR